MKINFEPILKIAAVKEAARLRWTTRRANLKDKIVNNFLKIQVFTIIIVAGLLTKEVLNSGFGFEISINTLFTFLWLAAVYLFKMPGRVSVIMSLLFISIIPFFMLFGAQKNADQDSILAYLILVLGILQIWRETLLAKENKEG